MVHNLDPEGHGFVEYNVLATYLCLLATPLPDDIQITGYEEELNERSEEGYLSKENFTATASFFDIMESSPHSESSNY